MDFAYSSRSLREHIALRSLQIVEEIAQCGTRQVRLLGVRVLSYPHPAPRGYGVRGILVGIYGADCTPKWIFDDVVSLALSARLVKTGEKVR